MLPSPVGLWVVSGGKSILIMFCQSSWIIVVRFIWIHCINLRNALGWGCPTYQQGSKIVQASKRAEKLKIVTTPYICLLILSLAAFPSLKINYWTRTLTSYIVKSWTFWIWGIFVGHIGGVYIRPAIHFTLWAGSNMTIDLKINLTPFDPIWSWWWKQRRTHRR